MMEMVFVDKLNNATLLQAGSIFRKTTSFGKSNNSFPSCNCSCMDFCPW